MKVFLYAYRTFARAVVANSSGEAEILAGNMDPGERPVYVSIFADSENADKNHNKYTEEAIKKIDGARIKYANTGCFISPSGQNLS